MILNKEDLKRYLKIEKEYYCNENYIKRYLKKIITKDTMFLIYDYTICLRKEEYFYNKNTILSKIPYIYYKRKKNVLGSQLGFSIQHNSIEEGLIIAHNGSVIINGWSKIGKNCTIHGDVCIGINGKNSHSPIIGDNVDIGIGAKIIGKTTIGNNVKIGANAVVTKNVPNNCTVVEFNKIILPKDKIKCV